MDAHAFIPCDCVAATVGAEPDHCGVRDADADGRTCSLKRADPIHSVEDELPVEQAAGRAA